MSSLQNIPTWEQRLLALAREAVYQQVENHHLNGEKTVPISRQESRWELSEAVDQCERLTAEHSRSFFLASQLLPAEKRKAMRVLYAFCRVADNLVDAPNEPPALQLSRLRKALTDHGSQKDDFVLHAWSQMRSMYQIPLCYAQQLLDGVERDLVQHRYHSFDDLTVYCYGVASTVGLMSMHITGFLDRKAIPYAIKLGVALQLTNILRDVGEDWAAGRLYLPVDELAAFGLQEADLDAGIVDNRWREFMRFQISRVRRLYAEAMPGIALLHADGRFAVAAAAALYESILDDIELHDYDVFRRRAFAGRKLKVKALLRAYRISRRGPVDFRPWVGDAHSQNHLPVSEIEQQEVSNG